MDQPDFYDNFERGVILDDFSNEYLPDEGRWKYNSGNQVDPYIAHYTQLAEVTRENANAIVPYIGAFCMSCPVQYNCVATRRIDFWGDFPDNIIVSFWFFVPETVEPTYADADEAPECSLCYFSGAAHDNWDAGQSRLVLYWRDDLSPGGWYLRIMGQFYYDPSTHEGDFGSFIKVEAGVWNNVALQFSERYDQVYVWVNGRFADFVEFGGISYIDTFCMGTRWSTLRGGNILFDRVRMYRHDTSPASKLTPPKPDDNADQPKVRRRTISGDKSDDPEAQFIQEHVLLGPGEVRGAVLAADNEDVTLELYDTDRGQDDTAYLLATVHAKANTTAAYDGPPLRVRYGALARLHHKSTHAIATVSYDDPKVDQAVDVEELRALIAQLGLEVGKISPKNNE